MIEAIWTSVDKPGVTLTHLTQSHNSSKTFPLHVENRWLLNNQRRIGSGEDRPGTQMPSTHCVVIVALLSISIKNCNITQKWLDEQRENN
jgi:hypothetical protein